MALQDTIKSWPWFGQAALFAVIAGALFFLGHKMLIEPEKKKIVQLEGEKQSLIQEINRGETAKARAIEFEAELKRLESQLDSLKRILPESEEIADLYSRIQQEGTELGLSITGFKPGKHTAKEYYEEWPISLGITGNYHVLAKFFERIGKLYRIINVNDVQIKTLASRTTRGGSAANTLTAQCVATTFIYREGGGKPATTKKGARRAKT